VLQRRWTPEKEDKDERVIKMEWGRELLIFMVAKRQSPPSNGTSRRVGGAIDGGKRMNVKKSKGRPSKDSPVKHIGAQFLRQGTPCPY